MDATKNEYPNETNFDYTLTEALELLKKGVCKGIRPQGNSLYLEIVTKNYEDVLTWANSTQEYGSLVRIMKLPHALVQPKTMTKAEVLESYGVIVSD